MSTKHAPRIIDALPPGTLQSELGWTERAIRHARSVGQFSGLWYLPIKEICERHLVYCPPEAFVWKAAPAKKHGNNMASAQGGDI